jgi:hypothetical protein
MIDLDILLGFRTERAAQDFARVAHHAVLATANGPVQVMLKAPRGSLLDAGKPFYDSDAPQGLHWRVRVRSAACTHPLTVPTGGGESRCTLCGTMKD